MGKVKRLTFYIEGEDAECEQCLRTVGLHDIDIECVVLEFKCPHCGEPSYAESNNVVIVREKH